MSLLAREAYPHATVPDSHEATVASYTLDDARGLITMTLRGDLTVSAFVACRDRALADPTYRRGMRWLIDCRVLTAVPSEFETKALAADHGLRREERGIGRTAIVVLTPTGFAFAQYWLESNQPAGTLAVFTSQADADAWLGLDRQ